MNSSRRFRKWATYVGDGVLLPIRSLRLIVSPDSAPAMRLTGGRPGFAGRITYGVAGILLGLAAWVLLAGVALTFARGALYPVFERGPYDTSWGGPTMGGAWAAHFAVSIPFQLAGLLLISGIAALYQRLTAPVRGGAGAWWAWPVTVVISLLTVLLVVLWSRQI